MVKVVERSALDDPATYALWQDIGYVMAQQGLQSLPLDIVGNWPRASELNRLLDEGILQSNGKSVKINLPRYQTLLSAKALDKLGISLPLELQNCLGTPWNGAVRPIVKCQPELPIMSSGRNEKIKQLMSIFVRKTMFGEASIDSKVKSLENVTILPVFHERDYEQYAKIKRAFRYHKPDFVGIEGMGQAATRYLVGSLMTARSFIGFPFCMVFKPYVYKAERIEFFVKHYKETGGTKTCIAAENDFAVVASICMGQGVPFFTMGIPEECIQDVFPHFHAQETEAWDKGCRFWENEAKKKFPHDLNVLCNPSKMEVMERLVISARAETSSEYKKQLLWSENYMASRIYDFCKIAGFDSKIVVFVGICHSKTLRDKLENGTWRYVPPINERTTRIPIGFAPSKIAAYLLLEDPTNLNFVGRFERSIAPSPMHAEFFGMREEDVIKLVESNMKQALVISNEEEIARKELVEKLLTYCQTNPDKYEKLRKLAENEMKKNGLNGHLAI